MVVSPKKPSRKSSPRSPARSPKNDPTRMENLKEMAKESGIRGYSKLGRKELCMLLKENGHTKLKCGPIPDSKRKSPALKHIPLNASSEKNKKKKGTCLERGDIKPLPHQIKPINTFANNNLRGMILIHSTGTGKTPTAVFISECFLDANPENNVIFIGPKSLTTNFIDTLETKYGSGQLERYQVYTYQGFVLSFRDDTKASLKKQLKNTLVIIDEAHKFREKKTIGTRETTEILKYAKKILVMSATPFYNNAEDIVPLITFIQGGDLKENEEEFLSLFNGNKLIASRAKAYFHCLLSIYRPPITDDYPERREHKVEIMMTDRIYFDYLLIENKLGTNLQNKKNAMAFLTGVRTSIQGLPYDENPKYLYILDKMNEQKGKGKRYKSVVYSGFKELGIKGVKSLLEDNGYRVAMYTGELTAKERADIVKDYNEDRLDTLVITKAGGEGLDLKNTANVFLLETGWNYAGEEQVISRAIRYLSHASIKNKKERYVDVWHLVFVKPARSKRDRIIGKELERRGFSADDFSHLLKRDSDLSADQLLSVIVENKKIYFDYLLRELQKYSIENNDCINTK